MKKIFLSMGALITGIVIVASIIAVSCSKDDNDFAPSAQLKTGTCPGSLSCPSGVASGCYTS